MEDTKTNKVLVNVVLDRSGSMSVSRENTIAGYNEYLNGLRADKDAEYSVSLIQFDSPTNGPELTVTCLDKPLEEVANLTEADYEPRGMTPLYDAIGECIRRVETKGRLVITVIITDGQENASQEFTRETIKRLIEEKEQKEHWTFTFLGANIDSYSVGGNIGVATANTSNYVPGMEKNVYAALANSTVNRSLQARRAGILVAASAPMFTATQRASMGDMTGGRPAAPPKFPQRRPQVDGPKRRGWRTTGVSNA